MGLLSGLVVFRVHPCIKVAEACCGQRLYLGPSTISPFSLNFINIIQSWYWKYHLVTGDVQLELYLPYYFAISLIDADISGSFYSLSFHINSEWSLILPVFLWIPFFVYTYPE